MIQLVSDSFLYPNGDLHAANANWVYEGTSRFQVSSNQVFSSTTALNNLAFRSDIVWPSDQYAEATAIVGSGVGVQSAGPAVRISATQATFYAARYATSLFSLVKVVNGALTTLASSASIPVTGDVVLLQVVGNKLSVFKNGVGVNGMLNIVDNVITSGYAGIYGLKSNTLTGFSLWSAGSTQTAYSVPDCRVSPAGPNSSRTVNGTVIYDVQTSSNSAVPSIDSRVTKPTDCRIWPNISQNSRTPGTYGPGE